MKPFCLTSAMTNMRGVFYPTGHIVMMFPTKEDARHAADLLEKDGLSEDDLCLATPQEFEQEITGATDEDADVVLPSVGTEGDTAQRFRQLAHEGQHALIVHARAGLTTQHVMDVLRDTHLTYGQRYRFLVIEDLA